MSVTLWPGVLQDEGALRTFLPGFVSLRDELEDEPLPRCARDPLLRPRRARSEALRTRVEANNARDVLGGTLTHAEWDAIRSAFGGCAYCEKQTRRVLIEHVIPIARGGRTALENIVPSCHGCNVSKRRQLVAEWQSPAWVEAFTARWTLALAAARTTLAARKGSL